MEPIEIVNDAGIELLNELRIAMFQADTVATGKTQQSLRIEVKQEGTKTRMQLFAPQFFNVINTGRRPTPDKKPSREMIANLSVWAEARGLDLSAVWAIAVNIQKRGTKLWQEGGRDVTGGPIDNFVNRVSQGLLDQAADEFQIKIRGMQW